MAENNSSLIALKNQLTTTKLGSGTSLTQRKQAMQSMKEKNILLLDISGSMADVLSSNQRRIDILWQLVQQMRSKNIPFRICAFNEVAKWCDPIECPQPYSSTNLAGALHFLRHNAGDIEQITLITDGAPDSQDAALREASQLGCKLNVMYVGPDDQYAMSLMAKSFCTQLANATGGRYASNTLQSEILQLTANNSLRLMLTEGQDKKQINL